MKLGVVGVGVLGARHANVASGAKVLHSVFDTDEGVAERVARECNAVVSGSLDDLLAELTLAR